MNGDEVVSYQPPRAFVSCSLRWSSGEWSKARGRATIRPDQSRTRFLCRSRQTSAWADRLLASRELYILVKDYVLQGTRIWTGGAGDASLLFWPCSQDATSTLTIANLATMKLTARLALGAGVFVLAPDFHFLSELSI